MKNNDSETVLGVCLRILDALRLQGPTNQYEVAMYLHLDRRKVGKYLELLAKKRFLECDEHDARIAYKITPAGATFAENLEALMKKDEF